MHDLYSAFLLLILIGQFQMMLGNMHAKFPSNPTIGYNSRPGNHRKSTNGLVPSEIDCSEVKNPNGGREAAQMSLRTQQSFSFGQAFHLVFGMLIVISFVSFYFWFLSTIVPTENKTVVPGHFPN
ncbi:hypothetical protein O6H91_03G125900 [Diphasiastrum complanatum]|uniref:Uncharacterized protein n=1 Tax=Diphasiastrum complanatum TaxID=34168 RepID=A0ACC2EBD1_DIPCM|nr:hypothetical protein O6H91_03G125900 [Diphasiastrum complanatum]